MTPSVPSRQAPSFTNRSQNSVYMTRKNLQTTIGG